MGQETDPCLLDTGISLRDFENLLKVEGDEVKVRGKDIHRLLIENSQEPGTFVIPLKCTHG